MTTIHYGQFQDLAEDLLRATEQEDLRITEQGDIRLVSAYQSNKGEGYLVANPTLIPFTLGLYIKQGITWNLAVPYVKYNSAWVQPEGIYIKVTGFWKRVY